MDYSGIYEQSYLVITSISKYNSTALDRNSDEKKKSQSTKFLLCFTELSVFLKNVYFSQQPPRGALQIKLCSGVTPQAFSVNVQQGTWLCWVKGHSGDTYVPAWRKALAVQENNLFLLKSWTKDHFIQLQNVAFSKVERGRCRILQFRP